MRWRRWTRPNGISWHATSTHFQRYDVDALTSLIREDASQSMPPFDMWLSGRDDVFAWWLGPGIGCKDSRVIPVETANGSVAFGQYKPSESGSGYDPWALQVLEIAGGKIVELTFFLSTERLSRCSGCRPGSSLSSDHPPRSESRARLDL